MAKLHKQGYFARWVILYTFSIIYCLFVCVGGGGGGGGGLNYKICFKRKNFQEVQHLGSISGPTFCWA